MRAWIQGENKVEELGEKQPLRYDLDPSLIAEGYDSSWIL